MSIVVCCNAVLLRSDLPVNMESVETEQSTALTTCTHTPLCDGSTRALLAAVDLPVRLTAAPPREFSGESPKHACTKNWTTGLSLNNF